MFEETGCHGIAIGRGALLNPWFFRQLVRREASGDPGPPACWADRVRFMRRHFQLQLEHLGERLACLTFRKVANWYCRVIKPGREIQQRLMLIESPAAFEAAVADIWERGEPTGWRRDADFAIPVPQGPQERW
jgi:tRNA-dihydrouridine synthase